MSIKKGDLVMVVKPIQCCGNPAALGNIFRVDDVYANPGVCAHCGFDYPEQLVVWHGQRAYSPDRLKKIDPLSTGEYDRVPQRLKEPA